MNTTVRVHTYDNLKYTIYENSVQYSIVTKLVLTANVDIEGYNVRMHSTINEELFDTVNGEQWAGKRECKSAAQESSARAERNGAERSALELRAVDDEFSAAGVLSHRAFPGVRAAAAAGALTVALERCLHIYMLYEHELGYNTLQYSTVQYNAYRLLIGTLLRCTRISSEV